EGDGNYHLQRFLEQEGSEVSIQVLAATLLYNLWEFRHDTTARLELRGADQSKFGLAGSDAGLTLGGLYFAELALRLWWQSYAKVLGLSSYVLPDMDEVARAGHSHYNVELRGGEGHLEVAKLILNVIKQKAHMTVSVKPFGCMPSSGVSDGVQSVITELYPEAIFCPVETSGDGAVNFYSRVQMYLFKARQRAREEFEQVLADEGVTEAQLREFLASPAGKRFARTLRIPPHVSAGTTTDLVREIAPYAKAKGTLGRAKVQAAVSAKAAKKWVQKDGQRWLHFAKDMSPHLPALVRFVGGELAEQVEQKAPSVTKAWSRVFDRATKLSADEEAQVRAAEVASATAPAPTEKKKAQGLPVVA
ncbi:MAG: hypothetical protein KC586_10110, partial [Myxococcales bacterium]|nr:hypothetical protein [Myxococcales bacterium]